MGRPKSYNRGDLLARALPVFWERGFADASLQDLERATGVNKSSLYAEFEDKQALFLACLRHYYQTRAEGGTLAAEPLGWANVEKFLKDGLTYPGGRQGCFAIGSLPQLAILPPEARAIVSENLDRLKRAIEANIRAEGPRMDPGAIAELVSTFFFGICVEQNLKPPIEDSIRKIDDLMAMIRSL